MFQQAIQHQIFEDIQGMPSASLHPRAYTYSLFA